MNDKVEVFLNTYHIGYEKDVPLRTKTWLKRGGVVELYITPNSKEELRSVVCYLNEHSTTYEIVGHTSNIYYLDTYNPSVIISTAHVRQFTDTEEHLVCDCGTSVSQLAHYCVERGYRGYAGLINLPGTVGAAICNNSSCFNCSIEELIASVEFLDTQCNEVRTLSPADFGFSFRNSKLKSDQIRGVILSAKLKKKVGVASEEIAKARQATDDRKKTQEPPAYTLGSCYAGLKPKAGTRRILAKMGGVILRKTNLFTISRWIKLQLLIYGAYGLRHYISPKNINTFKWLPDCRDIHSVFEQYRHFIEKAFENPRLEIEIRG